MSSSSSSSSARCGYQPSPSASQPIAELPISSYTNDNSSISFSPLLVSTFIPSRLSFAAQHTLSEPRKGAGKEEGEPLTLLQFFLETYHPPPQPFTSLSYFLLLVDLFELLLGSTSFSSSLDSSAESSIASRLPWPREKGSDETAPPSPWPDHKCISNGSPLAAEVGRKKVVDRGIRA